MASSNGNFFRVTGPLCGEFTGPGEIPAQRPVLRSFDVFFDLCLNKRLSKQPWGWWYETPSWSWWRHCNEMILLTLLCWRAGLEHATPLWNPHLRKGVIDKAWNTCRHNSAFLYLKLFTKMCWNYNPHIIMLNCVLIWLKLLKTKYFAWIAMKSKLSCHVMHKNVVKDNCNTIVRGDQWSTLFFTRHHLARKCCSITKISPYDSNLKFTVAETVRWLIVSVP